MFSERDRAVLSFLVMFAVVLLASIVWLCVRQPPRVPTKVHAPAVSEQSELGSRFG